MAYTYFRLNIHENKSIFHLSYRNNPFKGPYALCCGLQTVIEFLQSWQFQADDLDYLATLKSVKNNSLFPDDFLGYLSKLKFSCHLDAIPEGTIVFPHLPLIRVEGPLLQCQLLESPLLNIVNFQTLVATKAARVCKAAQGDPVVEFGLRRAQGPDGAVSASRAAYIGGCVATSNTLAGKLYDIPVKGTHAHSFVTAFPTEMDAFSAYVSVRPDQSMLLVDTYDTIKGVKHAIKIGKQLRAHQHDLEAVRLDSGDLNKLSVKARQLLDESGFENTQIFASNNLNEYVIEDLKQKGAAINAWGVGTSLATCYDQPALDGVYKLSAICDQDGTWHNKLKLSEQTSKTSNPGKHQVRRFFCNDQPVIDIIYDLNLGIPELPEVHLLEDAMQTVRFDEFDGAFDLLQTIFKDGKLSFSAPSIHTLRDEARVALHLFEKRNTLQPYPIALEKQLYELKEKLIQEAKSQN